ncbi:MAG: ABC transporter permease subunit [Actinomycetota bacterium]
MTTRDLTDLTEHEFGLFTGPDGPGDAGDGGDRGDGGAARGRRRRPGHRRAARWWLVGLAAAVGWSLWSAGVGRQEVVNSGGWTVMGRFWRAAVSPELSSGFLRLTLDATLVTVAFAVLGTALAVLLGLVGGVLTSETWWRRPGAGRTGGTGRRRDGLRPGWFVGRLANGLPRGVHEAVWGLFLVSILGRDPMVGVLAIAIPFGAVTAKVYADLIDETARGPYEALRAAGSGRMAALAYAVFPVARAEIVSYAFYRFECSVRSAVILGMIGAGGLGFQLNLSFQSLRYEEMWTLIYALVAVSALADMWGARLRRRASPGRVKASVVAAAVLVVASVVKLGPDVGRLVSAQTRRLAAEIAASAWPPSLPVDGWAGLIRRSLETVQMSLLAIALASALAVGVAFVAARGGGGPARRVAAAQARAVLLLTRAIPPPVWALLVLFVVFPGPLPGALALGIYNFGILGRLMSEVVENLDPRPALALRALGAPAVSAFAYATLPMSAGRFAAYALYRWEVAARETVVVGVVGAGGLGRLLEQQRAAFDYSAMVGTVAALIAVSVVIDLVSAAARRSLR